ncbi:MAG: hypothetical protein H6765_04585 [Candidatus Peribacteria bacterium]|nr:MAG: hypothetical protein H6765_04585 [Candidatus Peribacteria bacterium]
MFKSADQEVPVVKQTDDDEPIKVSFAADLGITPTSIGESKKPELQATTARTPVISEVTIEEPATIEVLETPAQTTPEKEPSIETSKAELTVEELVGEATDETEEIQVDTDINTEEPQVQESLPETPTPEAPQEASPEHAVIDLDTIQTPSKPVQTKTAHAVKEAIQQKKHKKEKAPIGLIIKLAVFGLLIALARGVYKVMFSSTEPVVPTPSINTGNVAPKEQEILDGLEELTGQAEEIPDETVTPKSSYTLNELKSKLEAQEIEARKSLNKAKIVRNQAAIKFGLAAVIRSGNALERIETDSTVTADEMQKEAEAIDLYLQQIEAELN